MAKGKSVARNILISILCLILTLVIASLVFVGVSISSLNSSIETKKIQVVNTFNERKPIIEKLTVRLKIGMSAEKKCFDDIENAQKELERANSVSELSAANKKLQKALDNLRNVMLDKYLYLENEKVMDIEDDLDTVNSRIIIACSNYNEDVGEFNVIIDNFPGDMLAKVFGFEKAEFFKI